jgi:hypothetical protein
MICRGIDQSWQAFADKDQIINILGFVGPRPIVTTAKVQINSAIVVQNNYRH